MRCKCAYAAGGRVRRHPAPRAGTLSLHPERMLCVDEMSVVHAPVVDMSRELTQNIVQHFGCGARPTYPNYISILAFFAGRVLGKPAWVSLIGGLGAKRPKKDPKHTQVVFVAKRPKKTSHTSQQNVRAKHPAKY